MNIFKHTLAMLSFATFASVLLSIEPAEASTADLGASSTSYAIALSSLSSPLHEVSAPPAPAPAPKKRSGKRRHTKKHRSTSQQARPRRTSGGQGFSYQRMEVAASTPAFIKTIIDHGQELLGLRYRTSGVAKWPLDCSGFVSYIYSLEGIKTPRSSGAMSVHSERISDPQPGDLLFFKGRNRGASRVGHVAMVISNEGGNIKMMHSSCSRGIVIENFNNNPYYTSRYLGAGRLPEVQEYWKEATPNASPSLD